MRDEDERPERVGNVLGNIWCKDFPVAPEENDEEKELEGGR